MKCLHLYTKVQDFLLLCAHHPRFLLREVPGHLPPHVLLHHGRHEKNLQDHLLLECHQWYSSNSFCHVHQGELLEVRQILVYLLIISTFHRDPFFHSEVASSAFCGMLDIPSMLYELSSLVFFLLPLLVMVFLLQLLLCFLSSSVGLLSMPRDYSMSCM